MKAAKRLAALALLTCAGLATPTAFARGPGVGWGPGGGYSRMYDVKTVETVSGEVVKLEEFTPHKGMSKGIHLTLKTATGEIPVHLGPDFYLSEQSVKIAPQDSIVVKGSRITFDSKPAIIASEITKGSEVLKLRDETGRPLWAGSGRGRRK